MFHMLPGCTDFSAGVRKVRDLRMLARNAGMQASKNPRSGESVAAVS